MKKKTKKNPNKENEKIKKESDLIPCEILRSDFS